MTELADRLAAIQARCDAATEGPWYHQPWGGQNQNGDHSGGEVFDAHGEYLIHDVSDEDGAFIAASRTDLPTLLAAVQAVMELHSPIERRDGPVCDHCLYSPRVGAYPYPCPTVQAITTALEAQG